MKKILTLLLIFTAFSISSFASHIVGGNFEYKCHGGDTFEIRLSLIRSCQGISAPTSANINLSSTCGLSTTLTLTQDTSYYPYAGCNSAMSSCNGGTLPGYQIVEYSAYTVISDTCIITMDYSTCCRNGSFVNITNSASTDFEVSATINRHNENCNNSSVLTAPQYIFVCNNTFDTITYNPGAYDPDGNELRYRFGCLTSNPTNYIFPSSCTAPLQGASIDSLTGQVIISPSMPTGLHLAGIFITELNANGDVVGETYHEIFITAFSCTTANSAPNAPTVSNVVGGSLSGNSFLFENTITACPGSNLCFDIEFTDDDTTDVLSYTSNITQALPGATVTSSGTNPLTINVCWNTPSDLTNVAFNVEIFDGYCDSLGYGGNAHHIQNAFLITAGSNYYATLPDSATICLGDTFTYNFCSAGILDFFDSNYDSTYSGTYNNGCPTCRVAWANPINSDYYILTIVDNGVVTIDSVYITVSNAASFNFGLPNQVTACGGDSVTLSVANNTIVNWSAVQAGTGYNLTSNLSCTTCSSVDISTYYTGDILVTATYGSGNCSATHTTTINVQQLSDSLYLPNNTVICAGDSVYLNTYPNASVQWTSQSGGNITNGVHISCDTCSGVWLSPESTETYTITESYNSSCQQSISTTITVLMPNDSLNLPDSLDLCFGDTAWLSTSSNGTALLWSFTNEPTNNGGNISNDSSASVWVVPQVSGYITVESFYIGYGCSTSDSTYLTVLNPNGPLITAYDTMICAGDTAILSSAAGGVISWTTTFGDPIIEFSNIECTGCNSPWVTPSTTTQYVLQNTTAESCIETDTITISVDNNATLWGNLTTSSGNPLAHSMVYFIAVDSANNQTIIDSAFTDSLGYYQWNTTYNGDIYVLANASGYSSEYDTYYDGEILISNAQAIQVSGCLNQEVSFSTLLISSINEADVLDVRAFPNPNNGVLYIESNSVGIYSIYSVNGQLMTKGNVYPEFNRIDISSFNSGIYFIQIENDYNSKFISIIKE